MLNSIVKKVHNMHEPMGNFSGEMETMKMSLDGKTGNEGKKLTEIKRNSFDGCTSRQRIALDSISKCEDRSIDTKR